MINHVKTVLNLEANARNLCQDTITNTEEMQQGDHQQNLNTIFLQSGKETACSNLRIQMDLSGGD